MRVGLSEEGREHKWLIWELAQGGRPGAAHWGPLGTGSLLGLLLQCFISPGAEACPTPPSGSVGASTPPAQGCKCWWHGARALGGTGLGGRWAAHRQSRMKYARPHLRAA